MKSPAVLILSLALLATACAENEEGPDPIYGVWGYELDEELGCVPRRGVEKIYLGEADKPTVENVGISGICLHNLEDGRTVYADRHVTVDLVTGKVVGEFDDWRHCKSVGVQAPLYCSTSNSEDEPLEEPVEEPLEEDPTDPH